MGMSLACVRHRRPKGCKVKNLGPSEGKQYRTGRKGKTKQIKSWGSFILISIGEILEDTKLEIYALERLLGQWYEDWAVRGQEQGQEIREGEASEVHWVIMWFGQRGSSGDSDKW